MISQTVYFDAPPEKVYHALIDEKEHEAFTGARAKIKNKVNGKFSVWDGYAIGENLELIKDKKIVQSWQASDWPKNVFSKVTFELIPENSKTKLIFTHENVPEEYEKDIAKGWEDFYWKPLKDYFSTSK